MSAKNDRKSKQYFFFSAVLAEKDRFFGRRTFILIHFNM